MRCRSLFSLLLLIGLLPAWGGAQEKQEQDPVYVFGTTVVINSGLRGVVYFISHSMNKLEHLDKEKPRGIIYTSTLNIPPQNYSLGFPGIAKRLEWFAINYTGKIWIDKPGEYLWELTSDDGSMLYIDDQLVVDNGGVHAPVTMTGRIQLTGGIHTIRDPYFQGPKYQVALVLRVAGPGQANFRIFNTEDFKPPANPETWAFPENPSR